MASPYLELARSPLTRARNHVMAADANLTGIVTSLAAGDPVSRDTIRNALSRCDHARQDMDRAIYAALGVEAINGRQLAAGDPDDMGTALITALERIEEKPRVDPNAGLALGPADCLPNVGSFW